ncbi:MAG: lysine--tRNA ligase [Dehalococcoidia bacterium]|nr:lysine--tRNA ligase [Dehalococcoidia bacterium]
MPSEEELINNRLQKRLDLLEQGDVYPARVDRTHTTREAVTIFETSENENEDTDLKITVVGRVKSQRIMGKMAFIHIEDRSGQIQLHFSKDKLSDTFENLKLLDIGDFLQATGSLFRTRTKEITLSVDHWAIITKSLRPLPEKWHGLTDIESRYRQRHLDLITNERSQEIAFTRPKIVQLIREFFWTKEFVEVETPVLQQEAGGAAARPFTTHHNALNRDLHLRISLELYLKRLLIGGFERVFEIGRVFRNEGVSTKHNPEFTLLESYEAYVDYKHVAKMVKELLQHIALNISGNHKIEQSDGTVIDFENGWQETTYRQALIDYANIDYTEHDSLTSLQTVAKNKGLSIPKDASWATALDSIMSTLVEPHLIQPTFIFDYPTELSPLAKRKPENPDLVERFELFILGAEIANAYSELNDPVDQRIRMNEQALKASLGDSEIELIDEEFLEALEHGMPPAGGLGIGIDRLVQLFIGEQSIREILLFPALRQRQE